MDNNILDLIIIIVCFLVFPLLVLFIFAIEAYFRGKKKFEEDEEKKERAWNEFEDIEFE